MQRQGILSSSAEFDFEGLLTPNASFSDNILHFIKSPISIDQTIEAWMTRWPDD